MKNEQELDIDKLLIANKAEIDMDKLLIDSKLVECEACKGKMFYLTGGRYKCEQCGMEALDDFGKIKDFLENNGPASAFVIAQATGVKTEIIDAFLKKGRVEIQEGSRYYLKCTKCGCSIRYGRYCPECAKRITGDIKAVWNGEVGERPKYELNQEMRGRMHFLNRNKDDR